jgi:hypothetical protein
MRIKHCTNSIDPVDCHKTISGRRSIQARWKYKFPWSCRMVCGIDSCLCTARPKTRFMILSRISRSVSESVQWPQYADSTSLENRGLSSTGSTGSMQLKYISVSASESAREGNARTAESDTRQVGSKFSGPNSGASTNGTGCEMVVGTMPALTSIAATTSPAKRP